jgi:hypothetical protein
LPAKIAWSAKKSVWPLRKGDFHPRFKIHIKIISYLIADKPKNQFSIKEILAIFFKKAAKY